MTNVGHSDVLVVGAGISGLVLARRLVDAGYAVSLIDKGRGVGGRMATRRIGDISIDHGAQFLTARSTVFAACVRKWQKKGWVVPWFDRGPENGGWVYRGVPTMNALAKNLASGLTITNGCRAVAAAFDGDHWTVNCEDGQQVTCGLLALTCPVPQALALVESGLSPIVGDMRSEMESISYCKTITLMATLDGNSAVPEPGFFDVRGCPVVRTICDNRLKGTSGATSAVTIHSTAEFAETYYDEPDGIRVPLMLEAAAPYLGNPVAALAVHRWGYSEPSVRAQSKFLYDPQMHLMVAGDGLGGGSIERAALSGIAAAEQLLR